MTRTKRPVPARAGFTLVEMMVALTAGAFAVAGAYYLTSTSSRLFNEQTSITDVQSSLRIAMEQIKRDIGRAGFLAARSRNELYDCGGNADQVESSSVSMDGFAVIANQYSPRTTAILNTAQNTLRADRLVLNGNYATSDAYLLDPSYDPSSGVVALQPGHESFIRSFVTANVGNAVPTFSPARFEAVFRPYRMVRIEHMQSGRVFFRRVNSTNTSLSMPTITLDSGLPTLCFTPSEVAISPVVRVRYQLEAPSEDRVELGLGFEDSNNGRIEAERVLLVRRELDTSTGTTSAAMTPVLGSARVVLDYAVEFQVNAWRDSRTPTNGSLPVANMPPLLDYVQDVAVGGAPTITNVSSSTAGGGPNQFRSAVVTIAARAPEADDRVNCVTRPNLRSPLATFRVPDANYRRCARVRSLRTEIYMPNMAFRAGTL